MKSRKIVHLNSLFLFSVTISIGFLEAKEVIDHEFVVKVPGGAAEVSQRLSTLRVRGYDLESVLSKEEGLFLVRRDPDRQGLFSVLQGPLSEVEYIEENFVYTTQFGPRRPEPTPPPSQPPGVDRSRLSKVFPNDSLFGSLWGLYNTGDRDVAGTAGIVGSDIWAPEAWSVNRGSREVVVAVIDTGVDIHHPDLRDNIWQGPGGIRGYNAINNSYDPIDRDGHGTHCAGTIGAQGNNSVGVVGVAWNVQIMPVKFMERGSGDLASALRGIRWAVDNGADILSNSWGGGGRSQALEDAIIYARDRGVLFVAAAGNDGRNNDSRPVYPANYAVSNVVSVAATDNRDRLASFSNYGARTVHLAAPGVGIYSTYPGSRYVALNGTSMATPHVAGAAALALSRRPSLTLSQLRSRLIQSVDKVSSLNGRVQSGGRLNLYKVVE